MGGKRAMLIDKELREVREALAAARLECDLPDSVRLIAAERRRQVEKEGWTPEHDDTHTDGELAGAAACYAMWGDQKRPPSRWPWDPGWWKPGSDPLRRLVKAGALIAAEIERLQRADADDESLAAPAAGPDEDELHDDGLMDSDPSEPSGEEDP